MGKKKQHNSNSIRLSMRHWIIVVRFLLKKSSTSWWHMIVLLDSGYLQESKISVSVAATGALFAINGGGV